MQKKKAPCRNACALSVIWTRGHIEIISSDRRSHRWTFWTACVIPGPKCVAWSSGAKQFHYVWGWALCGKSKKCSQLYLFDLLSRRLPGPNPEHPWGGESIFFPPLLLHMWHHGWVKCFFYGLQCLSSFLSGGEDFQRGKCRKVADFVHTWTHTVRCGQQFLSSVTFILS